MLEKHFKHSVIWSLSIWEKSCISGNTDNFPWKKRDDVLNWGEPIFAQAHFTILGSQMGKDGHDFSEL